jgi:hypothetical protein
LARFVGEALAGLTSRQQRILRMRFGIGGSRDHTLAEVGKVFGVTRERIRDRSGGPRKAAHLAPGSSRPSRESDRPPAASGIVQSTENPVTFAAWEGSLFTRRTPGH